MAEGEHTDPPLAISMTIAGMFAMACLNCAEIFFLIFYTFKRYNGLYFWSMLIAVVGTFLEAISNLFRLYKIGPNMLMATLLGVGWWGMVTGQSTALYSRLHLIVSNRRKTRAVLVMIIASFIFIQIPDVILWLGWNQNLHGFVLGFHIFERLQLVVIAVQETIISGLYIWEVGHGLKSVIALRGSEARAVVRELIIINALVILLDLSLITTVYTGHLNIQITYQPLVYSVKLKLEFIVLNKLVTVLSQRDGAKSYPQSQYVQGSHRLDSLPGDRVEISGRSENKDDPTHSKSCGNRRSKGYSQHGCPGDIELSVPKDQGIVKTTTVDMKFEGGGSESTERIVTTTNTSVH